MAKQRAEVQRRVTNDDADAKATQSSQTLSDRLASWFGFKNKRVKDLKDKLLVSESRVSSLEGQLSKLDSKIADRDARIEELKGMNKTLSDEIAKICAVIEADEQATQDEKGSKKK